MGMRGAATARMSGQRSVARGFISELDGLRGIAILVVMVHRFWPRSDQGVAADVAGAGWAGVDLFFVISGFLIAGILLDTRGEGDYFRNFYARRVLRIFPLYYLFVIGVLIAFHSNPAFRESAGSPLWYLLHLGNVPEGVLGNDVPYFLGPVWSLAIEEQFYLTFPWLVYALDRRRLTIVLLAMLAVAPAIRIGTMLAYPGQERIQYLFTLCRLDTIAIGCLLAIAARTLDVDAARDRVLRLTMLAAGAAVVIGVVTGLDRTTAFGRTLGYSVVAVGCAAIVALVMLQRGAPSTAWLRWSWLRYLGKLCFGLYLLHRPADTIVTAVAGRVALDGAALWLMPVKLGAALALATVSWFLIERPFMSLKDRFSSARHPSATEVERPGTFPMAAVRWALRTLGVISIVVMVILSSSGS